MENFILTCKKEKKRMAKMAFMISLKNFVTHSKCVYKEQKLKELKQPFVVSHFWNQFKCPIHLYLIFEKSHWKNQVRRTGFLVCFTLDFYYLCSLQKSILKLIFCRLKIQFVELEFSNLIFQNSSTDQQTVSLYKINLACIVAQRSWRAIKVIQ